MNTNPTSGEASPEQQAQPARCALATGSASYRRTCQKCQGTGEIHWNDGTHQRGTFSLVKCRRCKGTGKITILPNIKVSHEPDAKTK